MKQVAKGRRKERNKAKARRLDRKKVLELHAKGLTSHDIARHQGVAPSTVWRFLQQTEPERQALETFKTGRADVLARLGAKSIDVQERILDTMDDGVIKALLPHQKSGLLIALNAQHGTSYDKERLERGQSTQNVSLIAKMMGEALKEVGKSPAPGSEEPHE